MRKNNIILMKAAPFKLNVRMPGDKSSSHRAVMLASLAQGTSYIRNFLNAEDTRRTVKIFRQLGVRITRVGKTGLKIRGRGLHSLKRPANALDCGNSGTTMRLMCGILAGQPFSSRLIGDRSLSRRPMKRVTAPLKLMGAAIRSSGNKGNAPLEVQGHGALKAIRYRMTLASAQVKSSILLAALFAKGETIVLEKIKTRDHTERFFRLTRLPVRIHERRVSMRGGGEPKRFSVSIPGDISSAAFMIAIAVLVPGSRVKIRNLMWNETRIGFFKVLKRMGVRFHFSKITHALPESTRHVEVSFSRLKSTHVSEAEIASMIDELPILMVLATQANGVTWLRGVAELRKKETDRIQSMVTGLKRMGADIRISRSNVRIKGPIQLHGSQIQSFGDHRTAMSFIVAGLAATGKTRVRNIRSIRTSFTNFLQLLKLGGIQYTLVS